MRLPATHTSKVLWMSRAFGQVGLTWPLQPRHSQPRKSWRNRKSSWFAARSKRGPTVKTGSSQGMLIVSLQGRNGQKHREPPLHWQGRIQVQDFICDCLCRFACCTSSCWLTACSNEACPASKELWASNTHNTDHFQCQHIYLYMYIKTFQWSWSAIRRPY